MKIRNGFFSNSSSSSFCIYGANVTDCDKGLLAKKIVESFPNAVIDADTSISELCSILEKNTKLEYHGMDDYRYMGRSWCSIGGEETGNQFKNEVDELMTEFFSGEVSCETIEEAWYNG